MLAGQPVANEQAIETSPGTGTWRRELQDLVRAISGGFLFGIPLLYTMEVWWIGTHSEPWRLLLLLVLSFAVNWMLSHFAGFRQGSAPAHPITDALEALAIGAVASGLTLLVLGELHVNTPWATMVGMITLESVPFSLGVSISSGLLSGDKSDPKGATADEQGRTEGAADRRAGTSWGGMHGTLLDAGATIAGALFVAFSIAPTEEVPMLTGNLGPLQLIVLMIFSLLISYAITFESGFVGQQSRAAHQGIFQRPLSETIFSYLLSLVVAMILLLIFKQVDWNDPWQIWLSRTIVLGLPAAIGGSAGRLAVGG